MATPRKAKGVSQDLVLEVVRVPADAQIERAMVDALVALARAHLRVRLAANDPRPAEPDRALVRRPRGRTAE